MSTVRTFKGGMHPECDGKSLTAASPVVEAPLLETYRVPIAENAGKPPVPKVEKGDKVKKYQLIAEADGFVSANLHSPTSGEVKGIVDIPGPMGIPAKAIEIAADGYDQGEPPFEPLADWRNADPKVLLDRVRDAGIVGMGGAAFPSHVKLSIPPGKTVDTVIVNGAECEPYLTADHHLMAEHPEKVVEGAAIMGRILNVKNIIIGLEINKPDAIVSLNSCAGDFGVQVAPLKVCYPQGSEKQLISAIMRRTVPSGGLPADAGCVVMNAGSTAAIYEAVVLGIPLVERITTVTGEVVKKPGNFKLKIGTPVIEVIKWAGGVTEEPGKLILGGPMMGFAQKSFDVPVAKNSSGILLLPVSKALNFESTPCLRCGRCVNTCPMRLLPCTICTAVEGRRFDLAAANHVMDCLECGACAYMCPAHRPLVQLLRRAKAEIRKAKQANNKRN